MIFQDWLGTDILKVAERPLDPTKIKTFNPTMNDSSCAVCHALVDPMAGGFQNFQHEDGNQSAYLATFEHDNGQMGWYLDMRPPGFGKDKLPPDQYTNSLHWIAEEVTADRRFAISVTYTAFHMMTGEQPLVAPSDPTVPTFNDDFDAYLGEYYTLSAIAEKFKASNYNYKVLIKELVMSPYFRVENTATDIAPAQLKKFGPLGSAHLLTPEQLNRKIAAVVGMDWRNDREFFLLSDSQFRLLYGGIDSEDVTRPSRTRTASWPTSRSAWRTRCHAASSRTSSRSRTRPVAVSSPRSTHGRAARSERLRRAEREGADHDADPEAPRAVPR